MSTASARVALVTGAAGGIGDAVTQRFLSGGWHVAAADVRPVASGQGLLGIAADLSDVAGCRAAVHQAVAWGGQLDAVVGLNTAIAACSGEIVVRVDGHAGRPEFNLLFQQAIRLEPALGHNSDINPPHR